MNRPQVKVCGLTRVDQAVGCAELGADAIGCVFYPKSPRHLSDTQAAEIARAVPHRTKVVGVFVNASYREIMEKIDRCGLQAVQLHGQEPPELAARLLEQELTVIKALYVNGAPSLEAAPLYQDCAYLVECAGGTLPGGNARVWDWQAVKAFGKKYPLILAGGLSPENISEAITQAVPDAVDVSSGVESHPGSKDIAKVKAFLDGAFSVRVKKRYRRIY